MLRSLLVPLCGLVYLCSLLFVSVSSQCLTSQLSCPASSSLADVPVPFYSLTFTTDPASTVGPLNYTWSAIDTTESCPFVHTGIVSFDGVGLSDGVSGVSYIDLNAASGGNSVSVDALPIMGGYGGSGNITAGTGGWSFEVTVKAQGNTIWAKFYCLGYGAGYYDILTGFRETTLEIDSTVDSDYGQSTRTVIPPSPGIPLDTWQHIVAVYQNIDYEYESAPTGRIFIYLNGQLQQTYADGSQYTYESIVPDIVRPYSYLGRSCYPADGIFNGSIDTFRIYDRALTEEQANSLYYQQMGGCDVITTDMPVINDVSPNQVPSASAVVAPFFSLNTASDPRIAADNSGTALYGWRDYDFVDTQCQEYPATQYHQGLIVFPGAPQNNPTIGVLTPYVTSNFINLSTATGPNSVGQGQPHDYAAM